MTGQSLDYIRDDNTGDPDVFNLVSDYKPAGDQEGAISSLVAGLNDGLAKQTLLGVTGSGKTFTVANIIELTQRPAIILAPNKTLAAQLYGEMKSFQIMLLNILFPIMIIISQKHICMALIRI